MQLDQTQIAIHERGLLEIFDLSLHTVRRYAWPLLVTFSLGAIPMLLLNYFLVSWMIDIEEQASFFYLDEANTISRYLWNATLLVVLEAPLASVFATKFLGDAVFVERPQIRNVIRDVGRMIWRIAFSQLLVRGVAFAWLLMMMLAPQSNFNFLIEGLGLGLLAAYSCFLRALRPYVNEIILLEQNPLISRSDTVITINKRSTHLHSPSGSDLSARWLGSAGIAILLSAMVFGVFISVSGVFLNDWRPGPWMLKTVYPASLWIVAGFMTVVRFLSYLDLRIRHEGWEVELLLRAEAARLMNRLA